MRIYLGKIPLNQVFPELLKEGGWIVGFGITDPPLEKIIESIYLRSQWGKVKAEESKEI